MRVCVCVFVPSPQAESELQRATMDAARTTRQLEETIDEFERHKIQDIKVCLGVLFFFVFCLVFQRLSKVGKCKVSSAELSFPCS